MEIRKLKYEEIESDKELIRTRDSLMQSKQNAMSSFTWLDNEEYFNSNFCYGLYDGDELDVVVYLNLWPEIPVYSALIYTRKREGRIKDADGIDQNYSTLREYTRKVMAEKGLYESYHAAASTHKHSDALSGQFIVDVIETIPAGELSKYALIRSRLVSRRFDVDLKVTRHIMKEEFRNAKSQD